MKKWLVSWYRVMLTFTRIFDREIDIAVKIELSIIFVESFSRSLTGAVVAVIEGPTLGVVLMNVKMIVLQFTPKLMLVIKDRVTLSQMNDALTVTILLVGVLSLIFPYSHYLYFVLLFTVRIALGTFGYTYSNKLKGYFEAKELSQEMHELQTNVSSEGSLLGLGIGFLIALSITVPLMYNILIMSSGAIDILLSIYLLSKREEFEKATKGF